MSTYRDGLPTESELNDPEAVCKPAGRWQHRPAGVSDPAEPIADPDLDDQDANIRAAVNYAASRLEKGAGGSNP